MTNFFVWCSVFTHTSIFNIHVECIVCTLYYFTKDYGRTNNKRFNNKLKNIVSVRHPNIFIFFKSLQMCNMPVKTILTCIMYTECITIV